MLRYVGDVQPRTLHVDRDLFLNTAKRLLFNLTKLGKVHRGNSRNTCSTLGGTRCGLLQPRLCPGFDIILGDSTAITAAFNLL